jgi:ribosome-associated protein
MKTTGKKPPKRGAPKFKSSRAAFKKGPPKGKGKGAASKNNRKPAKRPAVAARSGPLPENPRAKALAQKMAHLTLEKKALDVVILDVRGMTSYADYFVIASGES